MDINKIEKELNSLLENKKKYQIMSKKSKAFGDGNSSKIIFDKTLSFLKDNSNYL